MLTTYIGVGAAVFAHLYFQRGVSAVSPADVLLPHRWANIRRAQGDHSIARGQALIEKGLFREALSHLTYGLGRSPRHQAGRVLYAEILAAGGRTDLAERVYLEGIPFHAADHGFLQTVFRFLLERQRDQQVRDLARTLLDQSQSDARCAEVAALAGAVASYHRGHLGDTEDFLRRAPSLAKNPDAELLIAKLDWDRGYPELALHRLKSLVERFPQDILIHEEIIRRMNEAGRVEEARRRALAFQIAHPTAPTARVGLLHAYHHDGDTIAASREAALILRDLPDDFSVLHAVAGFAADTGNTTLSKQLLDHVERRKLSSHVFVIRHIRALLTKRDFTSALSVVQTFQHPRPELADQSTELFDGLHSIALFGSGDREAARVLLSHTLGQRGLRAENLLTVARHFADIDGASEACRILARAIEVDPLNQTALARLIELELNLNRLDELPPHLLRYCTMRRPSPDILRVAQHKLGSDLFLFSKARDAAFDTVQAALEFSEANAVARR